jgi:hypothetical protein
MTMSIDIAGLTTLTGAPRQRKPPVWFQLPPGFFPADLTISQEIADTVTDQLTDGLSEHDRSVIENSMAMHLALIEQLNATGTTFFANGFHPEPDGRPALSTLSLTVRPVQVTNPRMLGALLAQASAAQEGLVSVTTQDFPAGPAVVADHERRLPVPGSDDGTVTLRQLRVAFVYPDGGHVAIFELSTKELDHWDDYRAIMLNLIAPTVTFTRPDEVAAEEPHEDRVTRMISGDL